MKLGDIVFTPKGIGIITNIDGDVVTVRLTVSGTYYDFSKSEVGMFYDD